MFIHVLFLVFMILKGSFMVFVMFSYFFKVVFGWLFLVFMHD